MKPDISIGTPVKFRRGGVELDATIEEVSPWGLPVDDDTYRVVTAAIAVTMPSGRTEMIYHVIRCEASDGLNGRWFVP